MKIVGCVRVGVDVSYVDSRVCQGRSRCEL